MTGDHPPLRRLLTVPLLFASALLFTVLLPALLPLAWVIDPLGRRRRVLLRATAMAELYLLCEVAGVLASTAVWVTPGSPDQKRQRYVALQRWWGGALFRGALRLYSLSLSLPSNLVPPGSPPSIFLIRHASQLDTLLPVELLSRRAGLRLRYVLKRELLWSPSLDIVGHRLRNAFVRRDGADSARELERLRLLGSDLTSGEGLVLYPEGTRFTPSKQERALRSIATTDPIRAERLAGLRETLPPRRGGVLALLEAAPDADIVMVAHTGLEGIAGFVDMLRPDLVGRHIEVATWRLPRAQVPDAPACRQEWLDREWLKLDQWIAHHRALEVTDGSGGD